MFNFMILGQQKASHALRAGHFCSGKGGKNRQRGAEEGLKTCADAVRGFSALLGGRDMYPLHSGAQMGFATQAHRRRRAARWGSSDAVYSIDRRLRIVMLKVISSLLLLCVSLPICAQEESPSMDVFGLKIGEKFVVPECEGKEKTHSIGGLFSPKVTRFEYVEAPPPKGGCYERVHMDYIKGKVDEFVPGRFVAHIQYAEQDVPQISATGMVTADIDESFRMSGVSFEIYTKNADAVYKVLKEKYRSAGTVKNYTMKNYYGASVGYYTVVWTFKNLTVYLTSSDATDMSSPYGHVTIKMPVEAKPSIDKNPL